MQCCHHNEGDENADIAGLLSSHGLRITKFREEVIGVFLHHDHALNNSQIEQQLNPGFDRVTLYRTLRSLEQSGIIHRVANENDQILFAICHSDCAEGHHLDNHVHFTCEACAKSYCLESLSIPLIDLPNNFKAHQSQFLIKGICDKCQ